MHRATALAASATILLGSCRNPSPPTVTPPPAPAAAARTSPVRTASQMYKNVRVLRDVPASDWIPAMEFISGSLGVSCEFCHTIGKFDSDSKATKQKAREMITMVAAINRDNFGGEQVVTCTTCHQGLIRPNAVPAVWNKTPTQLAAYQQALQAVLDRERPATRASPTATESIASYPAASTVLARYRQAVGAEEMKLWASLRVAGTAAGQAAHGVINFAVQFVPPDKMVLDQVVGAPHLVVSGDRAWAVMPQGRRLLPSDEAQTIAARARLFAPVKIVESPSMRTVGVEQVGDRSFYIVEWRVPDVVTRAYFDTASGFLYKTREETGTPLGTMVNETLFENYRDIAGVKLPFTIIALFMEDRIQYTVTDARKNAAVDSSLFAPPP